MTPSWGARQPIADEFPLGKCLAQSEEASPPTSVLVGTCTPTYRMGPNLDYWRN